MQQMRENPKDGRRIACLLTLLACLFATALPLSAAVATPRPTTADLPPVTYQVKQPVGKSRGVMLVIHGGGWFGVGPHTVDLMEPDATRYRGRHFTTVNIDYRPGGQSLPDVLTFADWAHRRWPRLPVCASGTSAGGHLSLMIAAQRPWLKCVISHAGPTDLPAMTGSPLPDLVRTQMAIPAFGEANLRAYSPARYAHSTHARVLLGTPFNDATVPPSQMDSYKLGKPSTNTQTLEPGPVSYGHGTVSEAALRNLHAHEKRLLASVVRRAAR